MKKITLLLLSLLTMSTLFAQIRPITKPMRAMQAEQGTYNLTAFDWGYYDGYEQYGCTQFILNTDNFTFYFAITLPLTSIKTNTVYTLDNMDSESTWFETVVSGEEEQKYYLMDAAQFKMYRDDAQRTHIEAVVTSGDAVFNITYVDSDAPDEYTTVDITMTDVRLKVYQEGDCEFSGYSTDYTYGAILDYMPAGAIAGDYDENACILNYCVFVNGETKIQLVKVTAKVVAIENGYKAEAWFYAYDGNCYHCTFVYTVPQPTTKTTIAVDNAEVDNHIGEGTTDVIDVYAISTDYGMQLEIKTSDIPGTYTEADVVDKYSFFRRTADNQQYSIYTANVTIEEVTEGVYHITGTILCYGDIEFTLDLTSTSSTALDEVKGDATSLRKIYDNGVLYMVRPDGTIYNAAGTRVR